jgi:glutamate---cysteine ligase / carboxylate-amine ligase
VRPELLRTAHWQAARYGLEGNLIDVVEGRSHPAKQLVDRLLDHLRLALQESGDWETVSSMVERILQQGNSAKKQREIYQRTGNFHEVVDFLIAQTQTF